MTAVILAAGFSKRFSGKKLLARINDKPIILHVIELIKKMNFEQMIVVYSDEEVLIQMIADCDGESDFEFIFNEEAEQGLSTSVKLATSAGRSDGLMFFMGDQPFVDEDTVNRLLQAFYDKKGSIIVPIYNGRRGNPVIFGNQWSSSLLAVTGDIGGRDIIRGNPGEVYEVVIENEMIGLDIDTKEDLDAVLKHERI